MAKILLIVLVVLLIIVLILLSILLFKWLWNITMPQVFGLREITFWQALRLILIASFLFGKGSYNSENDTKQKLTQLESKLDNISNKLDTMREQLNSRRPLGDQI
jgi:hypothetical protein